MKLNSKLEYTIEHDTNGPAQITGKTFGNLDDLIYLTGRIVYDLSQHANKPVSKIMTEVVIRAAFFEMTGKRKKDPEPVESVRVEKDTLDLINKALKEIQEDGKNEH